MESDLQQLSASLSRQAVTLAMLHQLQQALRQAQSPLSFVRQDGYARISALLEEHLADLSRAGPALEAVLQPGCWGVILSSLRMALAGAAAGEDGGAAPEGLSPHAIAEQELVALLSVVQAICMVHPAAKQSMCDSGMVQLLLERLPWAQPALACACLDVLLALQLNYPPAFQLLVDLGGMQQVSRLVQNPATPERVRTWGARFLNLVLTQLGPSLVEAAGAGGTAAGAPGSADGPAAGDDGAAGPHTAGVQQSLEAARQGVEEVLGSHAAALFQRRVNLQEGDAENKLEKLCQGISFFLQQSE